MATKADAGEAMQPSAGAQGAEELEKKIQAGLEEARDKVAALGDQAKEFIRERPGTALLVAVGVGFVLGRMASRR